MSPDFWTGMFYGWLVTAVPVVVVGACVSTRRAQRHIDTHPAVECQRLHSAGRCAFPACYCGRDNDGVPPSPKPQAWTDPEKEPRFQPGEET